MPMSILLRLLAQTTAKALGTGLPAASLPYVTPMLAQEVWDRWAAEQDEDQRRLEILRLTEAPAAELQSELDLLISEFAAGLSPDARATLTSYLGQVSTGVPAKLAAPTSFPCPAWQKKEGLLVLLQPDPVAGATVPTIEVKPEDSRKSSTPEAESASRGRRARAAGMRDVFDTLQKKEPELAKTLVNSVGVKLVLIPAGAFRMGTPADDAFPRHCEIPQHEVAITQPFYMGVQLVTQDQYQKVTGQNPAHFNRERGGGPDHPVEKIAWEEAAAYCRSLSKLPAEEQAGRKYRLPTEAEWEYACRAGTSTPFCFGPTLSSTQANFDGRFPGDSAPAGPVLEHSCKVGSYPANNFGLHDVHGNLWQWCADWFDADYYTRSPRRDPQGPTDGRLRVLRGGCWRSHAPTCRAAYRNALGPGKRNMFTGFRVVMDVRIDK